MKKWLLPAEGNKGVTLVAGDVCPEGALCEAPDHFTREMEPFINLAQRFLPDGSLSVIPELDPSFHKLLKEKGAHKQISPSSQILQEIAITRVEQKKDDLFNSMNPAQRFVKSILGDVTDVAKGLIVRQILKFIFGDKIP